MERILRSGRSLILFDPERLAAPEPGWFDPDWWGSRGAVEARLGGRGDALAVRLPSGDAAVLRVFLRGGWVRRLTRSSYLYTGVTRTRSFREWRLCRRLYDAGLPVPEPLAALCRRRGAVYRAALLTRRIPEAVALRDIAPGLSADDWARLGRTVARFAEAGLAHPDLNAGNVLVGPGTRFWLIDFDRARLVPRPVRAGTMLSRLQRSLDKAGLACNRAALRHGAATP